MSEELPKKRKVGALSTEEMVFLQKNHEAMTIPELAEYLNRTESAVDKYLRTNLLSGESNENLEIRAKLHTKPFYAGLKEVYTAKELEFFESTWVSMLLQFGMDVLPSEELQIKHLINLEILMHRSMKARKKYMDELDRIANEVEKNKRAAENGDAQAAELVIVLEQQEAQVNAAISAYANEHAKYLEKYSAITKELKGTRDQRLKIIEDGKVTWVGLIKDLDTEEKRATEGREMELMRLAMEKAKKELMGDHLYEDKKFDKPLLNAESVLNEEETEDESGEIL